MNPQDANKDRGEINADYCDDCHRPLDECCCDQQGEELMEHYIARQTQAHERRLRRKPTELTTEQALVLLKLGLES